MKNSKNGVDDSLHGFVVFLADMLYGNYIFSEINSFETQSFVPLFANHQIGQDACRTSVSLPEGMYEQEFAMDDSDIVYQFFFAGVYIRQL